VPVRIVVMLVALVGVLLPLCGCPPEDYPDVVPPTLAQINPIVSDTTLTPEQKRAKLTSLGLTPETINGLLRDERTGNQYGGNLRTAYNKVVAPNFVLLTPDEVQIYGDGATQVDPNQSFALTDAQAQAIVDFFAANDLRTPDELKAWLADPNNVVPSAIPANTLTPLFIDFDPKLLLPILP
jgi:hypothetical protein